MPKHRLVVLGDSLSQGFLNGAIYGAAASYPSWVARAMGGVTQFAAPIFEGPGGMPLDLEWLLRQLSRHFGSKISRYELPGAITLLRQWLDGVEDYWERGPGAQPLPGAELHHNLAVWGFEIGDALALNSSICDRLIAVPKDNFLDQMPEKALYRTARRVLNPSSAAQWNDFAAIDVAAYHGRHGGIENLIIMLGANHALGAMTRLEVRWSELEDVNNPYHERWANLYRAEHFDELYGRLMSRVDEIDAERVFLGTIPPVTRGVERQEDGYFRYYTRPWVWDSDFDPSKHGYLDGSVAKMIDQQIDRYNETIRRAAERDERFHLVEIGGMLDRLAYRRRDGEISSPYPAAMVQAFREHPKLSYLVDGDQLKLDTRYPRTRDVNGTPQWIQGGLFSLDGMHPTVTGYGLVAATVLDALQRAGVETEHAEIDWHAVVGADTLLTDPPPLLNDLQGLLRFLDRRGLLSALLNLF